jgi:transposase-like protein
MERKPRKKYSREFKLEAVRLAAFNPRAGPPIVPARPITSETARSLVIGNSTSVVDFLASQLIGPA